MLRTSRATLAGDHAVPLHRVVDRGRRPGATSRGFTCQPLSATVEKAEAIWMAVTAMPWPMGMLPIDEPDHWSTGSDDAAGTRRGTAMPVGLPKPYALIHLYMPAFAHLHADRDRADVARLLEDLRATE